MRNPPTHKIPKLDEMTPEELRAFWVKHYHSPTRAGQKELVGDRPKYTLIAGSLGLYADNKAVEKECLARGDLQAAQLYASICKKIKKDLPKDLQW